MKSLAASMPQLETLRENSRSLTDRPQISAERASYAAERAKILFGLYRKGDANDPEIYVMGITAILAEYEPDVMRRVTDPREGIARKCKWMPTIAELSDACEAAKTALIGEKYMVSRGYAWRDGGWRKSTGEIIGQDQRSD